MSAVRTALAVLAASALFVAPLSAQKGPASATAGNATKAAGAPSGVIHDVWVDFDVADGSALGMLVHIDFDVENGLNVPARAVAYFSYAGGDPLQDFDGDYRADDGQVSSGTDFTPIYDSANFEDLRIFMPYDQLHMEPGVSELEFFVELYSHVDGTLIAEAGPYTFSFEQGAGTPGK